MTKFPISNELIARIAAQHGTPCWIYSADAIRERVKSLARFDVIRYAQKANSNTHVLRLLRSCGAVVDAVSLGEIERALEAGFRAEGDPAGIVYASDLLDERALRRIVELRIPVNVGSPQMLDQLGKVSPGHDVWIRINPGFGSGFSKKTNTGGENSKHGIWHEHVRDCYRKVDEHKLKLVGLHMHIGSGGSFEQLGRVCDAMVTEVIRAERDLHAISAGGGLPVPYRAEDAEVDVARYFELWDAARKKIEKHLGHPVKLEIEPGRFVVAKSGVLVSEVRAKKDVGSNKFLLVDAGFNDLTRPAMYGSYHGIRILEPSGAPRGGTQRPTVVAGPLCEAGDVFTQESGGLVTTQELPEAEIGDLALFDDAGAYSASMSSNYNSRTLAPEVLVDGGEARLIRRRQDIQDLLALERVS